MILNVKGQITACGFVTNFVGSEKFIAHTIVKGQITACGFVTFLDRFIAENFLLVKGQITACGFVT